MTGRSGPITGHRYGKKTGPAPNPDRQRLIHGNSSATTTPARRPGRALQALPTLPQAPMTPPPPPADLGAVATSVWRDIWTGLVVLNPQTDAHAVELYARAAADVAAARALLERDGLTLEEPIIDPRGGVAGTRVVPHPAVKMVRDAEKALLALGDRLGLSPASRARLGLTAASAELAGAQARQVISSMFRSPVIDLEEAP